MPVAQLLLIFSSRVKKLMSSGHAEIGGETDEDEKYIAPTVLGDVTYSDPVMQEEVQSSDYMT